MRPLRQHPQELLPEKRFLTYPPLAKAVGSDPLAERLRRLRPAMHVFAHSHFAWDAALDGTRYVQAPLCYPAERARRGKSIRTGALAAAWQRRQEGGGGGEAPPAEAGARQPREQEGGAGAWEPDLPALLYTARFGGSEADGSSIGGSGGAATTSGGGEAGSWSAQWCPRLEGLWSEHYRTHARQPSVTTLAPWVAPRFERRRRRLAGRSVGAASSVGSGSETEAE